LKERINMVRDELQNLVEMASTINNKIKKIIEKKEEQINNIHNLELQENELSRDIENKDSEILNIQSQLKNLDDKFLEYHSMLGKNDRLKEELINKLKSINNDFIVEKEKNYTIEEGLILREKEQERLQENISNIKIKLALIKKTREDILETNKGIKLELEVISDKISINKERLNKVKSNLERIKSRQSELIELAKRINSERNSLEEEYNNLKAEHDKKEESLNKIDKKLDLLREKLDRVKEEHYAAGLKLTRYEDKSISIKEKLNDEFNIDPYNNNYERINISNYKKAEIKIKELKKAIDGIKEVNPGAIKEFNDLKSRLEYLHGQNQDLINAKNSILKIKKETEELMSKLFYKTFLKVKLEFETLFKSLFSGGNAELKLTDIDNLLKTGVDIIAQPPGKQLKQLSLMSGGERALTAIALVFAFLKVNPSPFYILDEIDATLDDANVVKFACFIREYSYFAQFIIITHRKQIMTEIDTIYGVTMEETGISKLLSLRF
jgi:chromosome segregation protein